jgi:hypothetical protein
MTAWITTDEQRPAQGRDGHGSPLLFVPACGSAAFVWQGAWTSKASTEPIPEALNRTAVPISFESAGVTHYVEACGNWRYEWAGSGWANMLTTDQAIPGAVQVQVDVSPPRPERVHTMFVVVEEHGAFRVSTQPGERPSPWTGAPPSLTLWPGAQLRGGCQLTLRLARPRPASRVPSSCLAQCGSRGLPSVRHS